MQKSTLYAALAATLFALYTPAQAQSGDHQPPYGFSGRIGLGVASMSTYVGSPEARPMVFPNLALSYRTRDWGTVEFGQLGLTWSPLEAGPFRFSLVAQYDPGRKTKDVSAADPTPGDKRLAGMGDVKSSVLAGVGVGYGPVMIVARKSLSDQNGGKGAQLDLTINHGWELSDRLSLHFGLGASMANQAYMQTYFGVTAAQAAATSFTVYTPSSGLYKVEGNVGAEYSMTANWKLQGNLSIYRLTDRAKASPIVGRRDDVLAKLPDEHGFGGSVALSVAYAF